MTSGDSVRFQRGKPKRGKLPQKIWPYRGVLSPRAFGLPMEPGFPESFLRGNRGNHPGLWVCAN